MKTSHSGLFTAIIRPIIASAILIVGSASVFGQSKTYDVRSFGARGDGSTLDSPSINRAIDSAAKAGGGTVVFPAGTYLSGSIHLKSNITLDLEPGCIILGAAAGIHAFDSPEPNAFDMYQDFGHSHWHNSLIWGENLENIAIIGEGMINGGGLSRGDRDLQVPDG